MDPAAMKPFGAALLDYFHGDHEAMLSLCFDNGQVFPQSAAEFFREPRLYEMEAMALDLCRGRVLDVGGGAGVHSLYLQQQGLDVCAIDVSPEAVSIMRKRGVADVRVADIMTFEDGPFDTLLMLGHNIGVVETLANLDVFLRHARDLSNPAGQILLTSRDVRIAYPEDATSHREELEAGRYFGEIRFSMEYRDVTGPRFGWLHVDPETLTGYAARNGWQTTVVMNQADGNYLARLVRD